MSGTYFQAKLKASTHPEIIIEASQKYQCRKKKKKNSSRIRYFVCLALKPSRPVFTCSKSTVKTVVLVSLLLTLNIIHTLF